MTNNSKQTRQSHNSLTIVGIGASAGGLAALKTFFSQIPQDSGLAYVVVVHLSPEHKSALAELLQPHIKMPVQQVNETMPLEPDHVYIIPPNCNLNSVDTHLRLSELEEKRRDRAPIDYFFRTLAKTHDGNSVGIILTGTGSDGTLGIKEIKEKGGLTIVQSPEDAEFDGMPQSAISTGLVDMILPLDEIPSYFLKFVSTKPKLKSLLTGKEPDAEERQLIQKIFAQVRARTGRDFSRYKHSTILRRLQRRMQLFQIEQLEEYLDLLRKNPEEVRALSDDFLINVTSFFRDPEVYQQLEEKVVPQIFDRKKPDEQIRVWSVGCASGEEAYSLAMLLAEECSRRETAPPMQVFASDLHEHSLKKARDGFYPGDIKVDVSEERLRRFFTQEDGGYRVRKELREQVIFTPHNLLGDPPFSRIDLIVCRNLLIYLKRDVQGDVFELFHYALHPHGFLVLGTAENLESPELFRTESKELSIYTKLNVSGPEPRLPVFPRMQMRLPEETFTEKDQATRPYGAMHQRVVERYAPPSLLLSSDNQVLHVSETAGRYLTVAGGELSRDVFKLIRPEIQLELRATIYAARDSIRDSIRETKKLIRSNAIRISLEGQMRQLIISVRVIEEPSQENVILVMFEEYDEQHALGKSKPTSASNENEAHTAQVKELDEDLQHTRQRMQALIEEYETSQEEMKASNEELQSANEELRSTLEELETSKEELQSMNEELTTLNQENRHKVEELAQLSDDLQNLLVATDIATLFLDREMRILRFTPQIGELFNVRLADRGRLISDQTHKLGYDNLLKDAQQVLDKLVPIEREIQDEKGRTYLTRVRPYRSAEERIEGIVITFVDISARKNAEEEIRKSEEQFRALVEASTQMVWTTNAEGMVEEESPSWRDFTGQTYNEWKGKGWLNAVHPEDRKAVEDNWQKAVKAEEPMNTTYRTRHKSGSWRWTSMRSVPLKHHDGTLRGYVGMNVDITEQKQAEERLYKAKEDAEYAAKVKEDFLSTMSHEIRTPLSAIIGLNNLLLKKSPRKDQLEYLNTLKFSSQSLLSLINDILDYSKIEAGKVELECIDYQLTTLINSIRQAHLPLAEEKGNILQFVIDKDIPDVLKNDPHKLVQVLNNLISNANKFTDKGTISLAISLKKREEDSVVLLFEIKDDGIGISEKNIQKIFDKFSQADGSVVRRYGGTGLGLTITRSLLQLMGSDIKVESIEGDGSVFYFTLKQEIGDEVKLKKAEGVYTEPQENSGGSGATHREQVKILLVEDSEINRMLLQEHLHEWWALEADEASNGVEAVEKARQTQYDLILMDKRMPEMDGIEASRRIRKLNAHYAKAPIIILTADALVEEVRENEKKLFDAHITKPFEPAQLMQVISSLTAVQETAGPVPAQETEPSIAKADMPDRQSLLRVSPEVSSPDVSPNGSYMPDITMPDFAKAEGPFEGSLKNIRKFYQMAMDSLQAYKDDYLNALDQKDTDQLEDIVHKANMLFDMLGLNALLEKMRDTRDKIEAGALPEEIKSERTEIQLELEGVINYVKNRLESLG